MDFNPINEAGAFVKNKQASCYGLLQPDQYILSSFRSINVNENIYKLIQPKERLWRELHPTRENQSGKREK